MTITRRESFPGHISFYVDGKYIGRAWWRGRTLECQQGADIWRCEDAQRKAESDDDWQRRMLIKAEKEVSERWKTR